MKELVIAEKKFLPKEYKGQRVVTFCDIDTVHQRAEGTAARNFRENRCKFIEGLDYFSLKGDALREYKRTTNFVGRKINELHLITETGYLMLVKSFTDDLAWTVQRELVNNYFRVKENNNKNRKKVVDFPQNQEFQRLYKEIDEMLTAVKVTMRCMNHYVTEEEAKNYSKVTMRMAFEATAKVADLTKISYKVVPEPY